MKRNLVIIATLTALIFTCGCNSSEEIENTLANKYLVTTQTEIETNSTEENSTVEETSDEVSTDIQNETETEETTFNPLTEKNVDDTKLNPAGINESIVCDMTSRTYGNATIELTLTDVMRGDEAWEVISKESDLNDPPEKDKEYILAKFRCKNLKNLSADSDTITINWGQFHLTDSTFKTKEQLNLIMLNDYLDAKLSEGDSCEGYLVYKVDVGQECYTMHDTGAIFSLQ
jgi:hypothetical protein